MEKVRPSARRSLTPAAGATWILALLLVLCLAECATEQRINRGSKTTSLVDKINGWRSQRGGSCLSYGHSCWGAHGKRSGKSPATAPDWYFTRLLRRFAINGDELRGRHETPTKNDDINAIFQVDVEDDSPATNKLLNDNNDVPEAAISNSERIPMLDDEILSKMKIWQMMKESSGEK